MGATNYSDNFQKRSFYKFVTDKKKVSKPTFIKKEKQGDSYVDVGQYDTIEGYLVKIEEKSYTYENRNIRYLEFTLNDNRQSDEQIIISMGWNMFTRGILNSLASCDHIKLLKISGYTNKSGNLAVYVEVNNQKTSWKHPLTEQPKAIETTFKNEILRDYEPVDNFFREVIRDEITPKIVSEFAVINEMEQPKPYPQATGNTNTVDEAATDDDLPF